MAPDPERIADEAEALRAKISAVASERRRREMAAVRDADEEIARLLRRYDELRGHL